MAIMRRLFAALLISVLGLVPAALPAHAATSSANLAAHWLTTQVSGGALDDGFSPVGASADGLIGLAAADDPALQPTVDALLATVQAGAKSYVAAGGGSAAGKLAIVAAAYGVSPTNFGGVDLVSAIKAGMAPDGAVGPYPSAFSSGLAMAGLERSGATQPATLTTWLLTQQNADGGFGYAAGAPSDADDTALAIVGLLTDSSASAKAALAKAVAWAGKAQASDGSWAGWVPVNSTCVLGSALLAAGVDTTKASAFVATKQLSSGAITDGTGANLMATSQCLPLLGKSSVLRVTWKPVAASPSPSPTPTAATTTGTSPAPTATPSTTPLPKPPVAPTRGVPAHTGAEDDLAPATVALGVLLLAGLGAVAAGRRR